MKPVQFRTLAASDKFYLDTMKELFAKHGYPLEHVDFGGNAPLTPQDIDKNEALQKALAKDQPIFAYISFKINGGGKVQFSRNEVSFDTVDISPSSETDIGRFANLVSNIRQTFAHRTVNSAILPFTQEIKNHYEVREAALTRLETLTANLVEKLEVDKRRRDDELEKYRKELEAEYQEKRKKMEELFASDMQALDKEKASLKEREESLENEEAKHKRRELYREQKKTFDSLANEFRLTKGTRNLRWPVHIFVGVLLLASLISVGIGFYQASFIDKETAAEFIWFLAARIIVSSIVFGTTAIYYAKWMTAWFQRHANEEFRLKRMALDLDRASWFVELAFQWQDENKEPIPDELVESMTRHLFHGGSDEKAPDHPADIFAAAFAKLKVSPSGAEIEIDRGRKRRRIRKQQPESNGKAG